MNFADTKCKSTLIPYSMHLYGVNISDKFCSIFCSIDGGMDDVHEEFTSYI